MMLLLSFVVLITLLSAARAAPSNFTSKAMGEYKIVPMKWIGQVHPGGPNVTLEGDIKDIISQIKVMNPAFEFQKPSEEELRTQEMSLLARDGTLGKRQFPAYIICNRRAFRDANTRRIIEGQQYLSRLPGLCTLPPGAGYCSRVSCSYKSGIYFCNDANHPQYINCAEIATLSDIAMNGCTYRLTDDSAVWFNAQIFRTDHEYSVLDAYGSC